MPAEKFDFRNAQGQQLAALLDRPDGPVRAIALFAHCFTCGKHNRAARRIAEGLKLHGIAVLRFDFTGLGASEGEFANTNFSSNVDDLVAAADHLRQTLAAPAILIGHSLGGAAVIAAAHRIAEARAVVTINAPFDPAHVTGLIGASAAEIEAKGEVEVTLAGRPFRVRRSFLEDVAQQNLTSHLAGLHKALLVFHSPTDDIVGIDNASHIFLAAKHPKSFISLTGADHLSAGPATPLMSRTSLPPGPSAISIWPRTPSRPKTLPREPSWSGKRAAGNSSRRSSVGEHRLLADEPVKAGGLDSGPGPYDLLLAALGACTAMTVRLYADRSRFPWCGRRSGSTTKKSTPPIAPNAKPRRVRSTASTASSRSRAISMLPSASGSWKSPTNARCTGP